MISQGMIQDRRATTEARSRRRPTRSQGAMPIQVSKQLAEILGVEFIRFDMSEYAEPHTVSRLIGI